MEEGLQVNNDFNSEIEAYLALQSQAAQSNKSATAGASVTVLPTPAKSALRRFLGF